MNQIESMRKAIIRFNKKHVIVLCNIGHLLEAYKLDTTFGGSMLECELGSRHEGDRFDRMATRCQGAGHQ